MDKLERMKQLCEEINLHNYNYYTLDAPTISDKEWDILYDELERLEKETGIVLNNSPTKQVGDVVLSGFKKVTHPKKLYSLNKSREYDELDQWLNQMREYGAEWFNVEYKFDGLRIVCTYDKGKIVQCATRGNGVVGEDVTAQILTIKTLPKKINYQGKLVVMGEAMIRLSEFDKYNKTAVEPLKNARNAAAGAIRNLDVSVTKSRNLDLFFYDVLTMDENLFSTQQEMHGFLKSNGFCVWDYFKTLNANNEIISAITQPPLQIYTKRGFQYIRKKEIPVIWTLHDCWSITGFCAHFDMINCQNWKIGCGNCIQRKISLIVEDLMKCQIIIGVP